MNRYGFMPHGYCFQWREGVLWLHVASDLSIAVAYFGIGFLLLYLVQKRRELPFQLLFILFSSFITLCGTTHLFSIWVLWHPDYYAEGAVKAVTAIVSIITLITLILVLPRALETASSLEALVSTRSKELADSNTQLLAQITARETIEAKLRESQKMEAIGQLTGGIAHDFNNMLQAIGASMEMITFSIMQGQSADAARHVDVVDHLIGRASTLTNRLLAFARRQPLQPRLVQVDALVTSMEPLLRRTLSSAGATIAFCLDLDNGGRQVLCDPNQLEIALLNLTLNARDAMPEGGSLVISTHLVTLGTSELSGPEGAEPGRYIEIVVADTGIGIESQTKHRVFKPFFTTKPIGKGTGLGLSQVYGFARQSGGFVQFESRLGFGTKMSLFLRSEESDFPVPTEPAKAVPTAAGHARLLLVEDEAVVRTTVASDLRHRGFEVYEAEDAATALELFRRSPAPDLLITDVGLPNGLNGRQLADLIRESLPFLPVLFITGYVASAMSLNELDSGMAILTKPFRLIVLAEQVQTMLNANNRQPPTRPDTGF